MEDLAEILFSVEGRLPRRGYWMFFVVMFVVTVMYGFVVAILVGGNVNLIVPVLGYSNDFYRGKLPTMGYILVVAPIWLFSLFLFLSVATRRLHDRDKSAQWLFVFVLLPWLMANLGRTMQVLAGDPIRIGTALQLAAFGIYVWAFVEFGFLRGSRGANRYGPDPLTAIDEDAAAAFE
jgi:uncharacterized membrane protein YhaH (DUF805 family)